MIKDTTMIYCVNYKTFMAELGRAIENFQERGYKVEIQYGIDDNSFSALLIARNK